MGRHNDNTRDVRGVRANGYVAGAAAMWWVFRQPWWKSGADFVQ